MMRSAAAIALLAAACGGGGGAARPVKPPPERPVEQDPGAAVPAEPPPGLRLGRNVEPTAYRATLRVDPAADGFTGTVAIDVRIAHPTATIWMHGYQLAIEQASATFAGQTVALTARARGEDLIGFTAERPLSGAGTLEIRYRGLQEPKNSTGLFHQQDEGDWYAFTQFEAVYARRVFPCFDEPDRKTPWTLTLEVPDKLVAVANTLLVKEEPAGAGWKRAMFAPSKPLPSYLVAFAVGPFEIAEAGASRGGAPIRILTPRGKRAHAELATKVVPQALALLEDYFDLPYPYDKLDFVPIPLTVGFGCMENVGMVTCIGRAMLFDPATVTPFDRRSIAGAAAHELAHMWFGDLVTLAWWNDIWLNEGLATWIEDRIMHAIDPRPDDGFAVVENHGGALGADSLASARAVRQPIVTHDDILNVFDGVSYTKAGAVMTMYERWLGEARFQKGIRAYLRARAHGNASTPDFIAAMSQATGVDLSGMATFLDQAGAPLVRADLRCDAGKPPVLTLAQSRYLPPGAAAPTAAAAPWQFPMCIAHDKDGARGETCAMVSAASAEIPLDAVACPTWVWPNAGGVGHYRVSLSPARVAQTTGAGWARLTPVERIALAGDLSAMILAGELDLAAGMALVPRLMREGNPSAVGYAVGFAGVRQLVPEARMAVYDRWLVKTFGAEARKLGWVRKPGEALDVNRTRARLVGLVASAGDQELRRQVVALARTWRKLPRDARGRVLWQAVEADPATFDRVLAEALTEKDREARGNLHGALTATRDPARIRTVLGLLLDDRVDVREVMWLPYGFGREPERTLVEGWVRDHLAELDARIPHESTSGGSAVYAGLFTNACDPARRDEIAAFVQKTFAKVPGAERELAQHIEGMDQCIAYRARVRPQVEAWLKTLR
jgi:cytosol alanyl aminopeptidase